MAVIVASCYWPSSKDIQLQCLHKLHKAWYMQGGKGAAAPTWATLQSWLHTESKHGILLVFENSEEMLHDDGTICEVLLLSMYVLADCSCQERKSQL